MSLVTAEDLSNYMSGINMNNRQKNVAQMILDGVQAELEMYLNRALEPRFVREAVQTDSSGYADVSFSPVSRIVALYKVTSMLFPQYSETELWTPGEEEPFEFEGPKFDLVPYNYGADLIVPGGAMLGVPHAYFVIDYITGETNFITPHLPALKIAILRVASREFQQMNDDTVSLRRTGTEVPVDPIPPQRRGWYQNEKAEFDRLRRRVIV